MKYLFLMLLTASAGIAMAQNQIVTPSGKSLNVMTDTLIVNGHIRVNSDVLKLNNYKVIGIHKAAGGLNSFVGPNSGNAAMSGKWNSYFGENSGKANSTGSGATFLGAFSGQSNTSGSSNTLLGLNTGFSNTTGSFNTMLGSGAGYKNNGNGNVFVGYNAGMNEVGASNKLYINNSETTPALIYGEFATGAEAPGKLVFSGRTAIGTDQFPNSVKVNMLTTENTSEFQLFVRGGLLTENLIVFKGWADYVFEGNYRLKTLSEVEDFIRANGHLPNFPSARQVQREGINVGDMTRIQQEKIEELTLYLISQDKIIKSHQAKMEEMMAMLKGKKAKKSNRKLL